MMTLMIISLYMRQHVMKFMEEMDESSDIFLLVDP